MRGWPHRPPHGCNATDAATGYSDASAALTHSDHLAVRARTSLKMTEKQQEHREQEAPDVKGVTTRSTCDGHHGWRVRATPRCAKACVIAA